MKVVNAYIEPIVRNAVEKKRAMKERLSLDGVDQVVDLESVQEDETLLDHLVHFTDGESWPQSHL